MSTFCSTKNIRIRSTHYFIMKILNKQELQQITINYSSDIGFKDYEALQKIYYKTKLLFSQSYYS